MSWRRDENLVLYMSTCCTAATIAIGLYYKLHMDEIGWMTLLNLGRQFLEPTFQGDSQHLAESYSQIQPTYLGGPGWSLGASF